MTRVFALTLVFSTMVFFSDVTLRRIKGKMLDFDRIRRLRQDVGQAVDAASSIRGLMLVS